MSCPQAVIHRRSTPRPSRASCRSSGAASKSSPAIRSSSERLARGIPAAGVGVGRHDRRPPALLAIDGRVDGAGRRAGLLLAAARNDHALRPPAGAPDGGRAAPLRHGDAAFRRRARPGGDQPHGPADEDRRQPAPPGEPRRHRRAGPGVDPHAVRPRSLANGAASRRDFHLGRTAGRDPRSARRRGRRRRRARLEPADHVADARTAANSLSRSASRKRGGISTSQLAATTRERPPIAAFGEDVQPIYRFENADVVAGDRRRLPLHGGGGRSLRPRLHGPPRRRKRRPAQPPLRHRIRLHPHRRRRRPPLAA